MFITCTLIAFSEYIHASLSNSYFFEYILCLILSLKYLDSNVEIRRLTPSYLDSFVPQLISEIDSLLQSTPLPKLPDGAFPSFHHRAPPRSRLQPFFVSPPPRQCAHLRRCASVPAINTFSPNRPYMACYPTRCDCATVLRIWSAINTFSTITT
jgi:hypothetical protein